MRAKRQVLLFLFLVGIPFSVTANNCKTKSGFPRATATPNCSYKSPLNDQVIVSLNKLGLRDHFDERTSSDDLIIFLIGDNLVFGEHLPDEKTLPRQLEMKLTEMADRKVKVVNLGLNDSNPYESFFLLQKAFAAYRPDVVVYCSDGSKDILLSVALSRFLKNSVDESGLVVDYLFSGTWIDGSLLYKINLSFGLITAGLQSKWDKTFTTSIYQPFLDLLTKAKDLTLKQDSKFYLMWNWAGQRGRTTQTLPGGDIFSWIVGNKSIAYDEMIVALGERKIPVITSPAVSSALRKTPSEKRREGLYSPETISGISDLFAPRIWLEVQ